MPVRILYPALYDGSQTSEHTTCSVARGPGTTPTRELNEGQSTKCVESSQRPPKYVQGLMLLPCPAGAVCPFLCLLLLGLRVYSLLSLLVGFLILTSILAFLLLRPLTCLLPLQCPSPPCMSMRRAGDGAGEQGSARTQRGATGNTGSSLALATARGRAGPPRAPTAIGTGTSTAPSHRPRHMAASTY